MTVTVNGVDCELEAGTTIAALLRARGAREKGSAVAVDGVVVPRGQWEHVVLCSGQTIELVHAVQGG